MKTCHHVWKKLVIGLFALFLSTTALPITGSLPVEREQSMMNGCSDGINLSGLMGQNGWYVSPVVVTLDFGSNRTYYMIDQGGWQEYITPFVVSTEGLHTVICFYIDSEGNQSQEYSTSFKMDMTPPTVTIMVERIGFSIGVTVNASDNMSGVVLIEIYLDDSLVANLTTAPYYFVMWIGLGEYIVKVIVYDAAGLSASASVSTPYPLDEQKPYISDTPILPPIDRTYFIGQIHNLTIDGNDYHFESYNIRKIGFWRYSLRSWGFSFDHFMGHYSCGWGGAEFHGLLKPNFIFGYFTFLQGVGCNG